MKNVKTLITKAFNNERLRDEEIANLFESPLLSDDAALIHAASQRLSMQVSEGLAEVHAQIGLNIALCPRNCGFCSFALKNRIFTESSELSADEVVERALEFESDAANAVLLMATANYSFDKYIEIAKEVRHRLKPETVFVANIDDFDAKQASRLKDAGFQGIYHAVRLGEGTVTSIDPSKRIATMKAATDAGLIVGTCVEPVGNEHSIEQLVEMTVIARDMEPAFSGAARRIPIPNTVLFKHGWVSKAKMAHIVAVVRLATQHSVKGNCTHEPCISGALAGANLFWAETGSNPRDTEKDTESKRGMTVQDCKLIFEESGWKVLDGPSRFYGN